MLREEDGCGGGRNEEEEERRARARGFQMVTKIGFAAVASRPARPHRDGDGGAGRFIVSATRRRPRHAPARQAGS